MAKFVWQDGTLVSKAKVEVGGNIYEVDPEEYSGSTPLSASNLNAMVNSTYSDLQSYADSWKGTILWTNPNPTSSFASQTITLNSNDYDLLELIWANTTSEGLIYSTKVLKGEGTRLFDIYVSSASKFGVRSRNFSYSNDTQYSVAGCSKFVLNDNQVTTENTACVPLYVIGYKTELFD